MTDETGSADTFIMVTLPREDEEVSKVATMLELLGIPTEMVGRGHQLRRAPSIVLRVPPHRVAEAILALELQGYADVVAYQVGER